MCIRDSCRALRDELTSMLMTRPNDVKPNQTPVGMA